MDNYGYKANRKRLLGLCKGEAISLSLAFVSFAVSTYSNASLPSLLGKLLDSSSKSDKPDTALRYKAGLIFVLGGIGSTVRTMTLGRIEGRVKGRLMKEVMEATVNKDVETMEEEGGGNKEEGKEEGEKSPPTSTYILSTTIPKTASTLTSVLPSYLRSISGTLNSLYMLVKLSPDLTLYAGILVPTVGIGSVVLSKFKKRKRLLREEQEAKAERFANERIRNIKMVKAAGTEGREVEIYKRTVDQAVKETTMSSLADGIFLGFLFTSTALTLSLVLSRGGTMVRNGLMTQGDLTSYATYTFLLGAGAAGVTKAKGEFKDGIEGSGKVWKIIDEGKKGKEGGKIKEKLQDGNVVVSSLSYVYPGGDGREAVSNLDFKVSQGEVVGITGSNGSGKSTVAMILKGIYHLGVTGNVNVGGVKIEGGKFLEGANVVMQNVGFVDGTVMDNVLYGREEEFGEEECRRVLKVVKGDFVEDIEGGINGNVGINGSKLSGGQRQRIGLARGLVGNPKVLILDEPDTFLDKDSKDIVSGCVQSAHESGATVIIITHDEETVGLCDRVVGMEDGKKVYDGKKEGWIEIVKQQEKGK